MLRKFLNGIIFGLGFGVAAALAFSLSINFFFGSVSGTKIDSGTEINTAPEVAENFLGTTGSYQEGFNNPQNNVLSVGKGEIVGSVMLNNKPHSGLRLRLALNNSVYTQWATSDISGAYTISVPFGKYKINGYELDRSTANKTLAGKIAVPYRMHHSTPLFEVKENQPGIGLTFKYIDPVNKMIDKKQYSITEEIKIRWEPFPGAEKYSIQLLEGNNDNRLLYYGKKLFERPDIPKVKTTEFILSDFNKNYKVNHFYRVEINALDKTGRTISQTPSRYSSADFQVVE